ncbi:MAG: KamA family radical SAM protein [Kiritimatiellae bacterium]|nr:KamA family radical SAM protein [Kiritimatiellia bacterium]
MSPPTGAPPTAARPPAGRGWRAQWRQRLCSLEELSAFLGRPFEGDWAVEPARTGWRMAVTRYYASLIRRLAPTDPIARQCVPSREELTEQRLPPDPFDELGHRVAPGLVRRYRDRAAFWATGECAVRCRHCTRRNELGDPPPRNPTAAVRWLRQHPEVRELLITGGDPLTLEDAELDRLLAAFRSVPSLEVLRLGTRMPVVLPMRITRALCRMLRRHAPLWVHTHFNHPAELTAAALAACGRLVDAGIPLGNQTVLLRGVNDTVETLGALFRGLVRARVRPYYLLHCDPVRGAGHFRVPLRRALHLVETLRGRLSGLAMPTFVVDMRGGRSKTPLAPGAVIRWTTRGAWLRGPGGVRWFCPDPRPSRRRDSAGPRTAR